MKTEVFKSEGGLKKPFGLNKMKRLGNVPLCEGKEEYYRLLFWVINNKQRQKDKFVIG